MKILIASDSFKGSLSSQKVGDAISKGLKVREPSLEIEVVAVADGGEGSLEAINTYINGEEIRQFVKDPFWRTIAASYLRIGTTAYIEMAAASGLHLLKAGQRNPEYTTTYGTGQQIKHAVKNGCKEVYLFVGGTATNDGGIGMGQTLGYQFLDENDEAVMTIGEGLNQIRKIIRPEDKLDFKLKIVCDVTNPMFGPNGAAHVFAAQKGADADGIERLDAGLRNLAKVIKNDLGKDVSTLTGGGAAGAATAGLSAFFDAEILEGTQTIFEFIGLKEKVEAADLIITGEGKIDKQTLSGKLVSGICSIAKAPVLAVCGVNELSEETWKMAGIQEVFTLVDGEVSQEEAMEKTEVLLEAIGEKIGERFLK